MAAEEANIRGRDQGKSFLNKLVSKMPAPVFSGREADWADFAREWKRYLQILCPDGMERAQADMLVLEALRGSLDPASRKMLLSALETDPGLTYRAFWRILEQEFSRDLTTHYRQEWEKVTLEGKRHITPLMWRNFESDFAFKAARVGDVTNREMEERLLLQLPPI